MPALLLLMAWRMVQAESPAARTPDRLALSLAQTLEAALAASDQWKSARSAAQAAASQALAQRGNLYPHLSVDGYYRYVGEVPLLPVAPGAPPISFTTHNQYSVGPDVNWTVFSGGTLTEAWR